jgi:hypothetical protein
MATGDFLWLKTKLAFMAGRNSVAELDSNPNVPSDSLLAGQCVNEAYLDCYSPPPGGKRPGWALQTLGLQYSAPVSATIGVTQGSRTFTGYTPPANTVGSIVNVGGSYYTYAGQVGETGTGTVSPATIVGQTNDVALVNGQQSYAITFNTPFASVPPFFEAQIFMVSSSAEAFFATPDYSTLTASGVTVWLNGIPTAASAGSFIRWNASGPAGVPFSTGAYQFVEPVAEPTGSYSALFYHNSHVLPAADIELQFGPLVLGWGLLRPMNGRVEAVKWRQITYGDFWSPTPFGVGQMTSINWPGGVSQPTGTPIFYYIDNSAMQPAAPTTCRLVIWPLPTQLTTVQYEGWIMPVELSADGDLPIMPANLITRCLLPLCRERWVMNYKKYTGGNQQMIIANADKARAVLWNSSPGQRDRAFRQPLHNC